MKKTVDTSKHILVPGHSKLNEKERKELLAQYGIVPDQLPQMAKHDPAIHGMGAKIGDIIKIVRQSPTAGESVFYRVVVNG